MYNYLVVTNFWNALMRLIRKIDKLWSRKKICARLESDIFFEYTTFGCCQTELLGMLSALKKKKIF